MSNFCSQNIVPPKNLLGEALQHNTDIFRNLSSNQEYVKQWISNVENPTETLSTLLLKMENANTPTSESIKKAAVMLLNNNVNLNPLDKAISTISGSTLQKYIRKHPWLMNVKNKDGRTPMINWTELQEKLYNDNNIKYQKARKYITYMRMKGGDIGISDNNDMKIHKKELVQEPAFPSAEETTQYKNIVKSCGSDTNLSIQNEPMIVPETKLSNSNDSITSDVKMVGGSVLHNIFSETSTKTAQSEMQVTNENVKITSPVVEPKVAANIFSETSVNSVHSESSNTQPQATGGGLLSKITSIFSDAPEAANETQEAANKKFEFSDTSDDSNEAPVISETTDGVSASFRPLDAATDAATDAAEYTVVNEESVVPEMAGGGFIEVIHSDVKSDEDEDSVSSEQNNNFEVTAYNSDHFELSDDESSVTNNEVTTERKLFADTLIQFGQRKNDGKPKQEFINMYFNKNKLRAEQKENLNKLLQMYTNENLNSVSRKKPNAVMQLLLDGAKTFSVHA